MVATLYLNEEGGVLMRAVREKLTAEEKGQIWERWREGESLKSIGRGIGKNSSSVHWYVTKHGGIEPRARKRSKRALSALEREEISRGLSGQRSLRAIGRLLNRPASTISREVNRNGGREAYRAAVADARAWKTAKRAKRCKLLHSAYLL